MSGYGFTSQSRVINFRSRIAHTFDASTPCSISSIADEFSLESSLHLTTDTSPLSNASYLDEPVVRKPAGTDGTIHYYHRNGQYSITAMTTSTGAVAERYAYTAYGQPTLLNASGSVLTNSAVSNRYTYTGREWDETLGLHHFRARWMSPLAGRFLGRDPIGYVDGQLLYTIYIGLRSLDPTRLRTIPDDYKVYLDWTNCAGFTLHLEESGIDPTGRLDALLAAFEFTDCRLGTSSQGCLDECSKGKDCRVVYMYKVKPHEKMRGDVDAELQKLLPMFKDDKRVIDVSTMLFYRWSEVIALPFKNGVQIDTNIGRIPVIDFHVMKCKGEGFIFQPCRVPKGGHPDPRYQCQDHRANPPSFVPSPEKPEYIDISRVFSTICCCKQKQK